MANDVLMIEIRFKYICVRQNGRCEMNQLAGKHCRIRVTQQIPMKYVKTRPSIVCVCGFYLETNILDVVASGVGAIFSIISSK